MGYYADISKSDHAHASGMVHSQMYHTMQSGESKLTSPVCVHFLTECIDLGDTDGSESRTEANRVRLTGAQNKSEHWLNGTA